MPFMDKKHEISLTRCLFKRVLFTNKMFIPNNEGIFKTNLDLLYTSQ